MLRKDAGLRDGYAAVKMALAQREWENMIAYTKAKNGILGKILGKAGIGESDLANIEKINTRVVEVRRCHMLVTVPLDEEFAKERAKP